MIEFFIYIFKVVGTLIIAVLCINLLVYGVISVRDNIVIEKTVIACGQNPEGIECLLRTKRWCK